MVVVKGRRWGFLRVASLSIFSCEVARKGESDSGNMFFIQWT